ncbi:MAG: AmmeMemoRadiSam system radical SAM enzyme [Deltaproteobacteria bacterium]|nr:AmmeMemoRadiSam system radical SAM enzyme [Deltaproteobacteria bacterium]
MDFSRREFVKLFAFFPSILRSLTLSFKDDDSLKESMFYKKLPEKKIECQICPKKCRVSDLERGYCGNKENRGGKYYSLVYSKPCAMHVDPIEKKPLFHYLPGSRALSIATAGCNMECKFCQNWEISQFRPEQVRSSYLPPKKIVQLAKETKSLTIAYTYTEPVVFYTYMYDTAKMARAKGIGSVMISNGYINEEPMKKLCEILTGVKIDLKAFTENFYKKICSGELKPVLNTLKLLRSLNIWYEIVVLIIPTLNDSITEIKNMSSWIIDELGDMVPVHFTRFYPTYKIKNLPPTPVSTLEEIRNTALSKGLKFVYIGNVPGHEAENTYCPSCGKILIQRVGFMIIKNLIKEGKCPYCNKVIPGVWSNPL